MKIIQANQTHRSTIIELLKTEKLPVDDLPGNLDHFFVAIIEDVVVGAIGLECKKWFFKRKTLGF
jgi:amino-acid N-acetyltransferase